MRSRSNRSKPLSSANGELPLEGHVLPSIYEDETLYSWCARFHRLSCNSLPLTTSKQLFGRADAGLKHGIPGNLAYFVDATSASLGSVEELLYRHTQFALFAPLLSPERCIEVVNGLRQNQNATAYQRLGLSRAGGEFASPLRSCSACLEEDGRHSPAGWWRVTQQWLPTRICLKHLMPLREVAANMDLRNWVLPDHVGLTTQLKLDRRQKALLINIAHWTEFWVTRHDLHVDWLRYFYLLKAKKRDWIAFDGTLRFAAMREQFLGYYDALGGLPGLGFLQEARSAHGGFLGMLFRKFAGQRHPIKHIYLAAFLFEDPSDFIAEYSLASGLVAESSVEGLLQRLTEKRSIIRSLVSIEELSANAAASKVGVTATTALRFLRKVGVDTKKRPRVLTGRLQKRLDKMLSSGAEHDSIAATLSIRKGLVREYLRKQPSLRETWLNARFAHRVDAYRKNFLRVLRVNPGIPIKRIRRIPKCGFEWLYRNDREWLERNLPYVKMRKAECD